jgi:hypothetical protein
LSERFRVDPGHQMLQLALADPADLFDVMMVGLNFVNQTAAIPWPSCPAPRRSGP